MKTESAVLTFLLSIHPVQVTVAEVARELVGEDASFLERDATDRAAKSLSGFGLIHLHRNLLSPTRAALRAKELFDL
ncbi:MAG: hypothetical protein H0X42_14245 [Solirubrobacterales bacterium]|nr:hypothetical protein [Solirubrobacterales bacterium]